MGTKAQHLANFIAQKLHDAGLREAGSIVEGAAGLPQSKSRFIRQSSQDRRFERSKGAKIRLMHQKDE